MEQQNFTEIISNIDRFEISDLHEELVMCRTSKSRIPEIERLFKKALGEGSYYNVCYNNPAYEFIIDSVVYYRHVPEDMRHICNMALKKCFRFYTSTTNHFLKAYVIKVGDKFYPVIQQTIDPVNAYEFHNMYEYNHFYMAKNDVEEIISYLNSINNAA
jgi:hypothetical protein